MARIIPMPRVRHYIALGIIIFIAVVVANLPAKLLFDAVESSLTGNTVIKFSEAEGSVWKGRLGLEYAGINLTVDWDILQMQILLGRLAADVSVTDLDSSSDSRVTGKVFSSLLSSAGFYAVNGGVSAVLLNRLAKNQFSMEQNIALDALTITYQNQQFTAAAGEITWPGGRIGYEDPNRGQQQVVLPALKVTLEADDGHLLASLMPQGAGEMNRDVLADANIDGEGIATVAVRKRLLDLVGQRWGNVVNPDDVVLEIQQPVF